MIRRNRPASCTTGGARRDPRAERESMEPAPEVATRIRRDPRAQRAVGLLGPGQRLRIDRARPMALVDASAAPAMSLDVTGSRPVVIDNPACWIMAIPDMLDGRLSPHDRDVLNVARGLADTLNGAVIAIAFASGEDLGAVGVDRVMRFDHINHQGYAPETRAAAVLAAVDGLQPRHVVFPDSVTGGDIGRRVAGRLGELPATHVQRIDAGETVSRGDGGRSGYLRETPKLILVDPGVVDTAPNVLCEGRGLDAPARVVDSRVTDLGLLKVDPNAVPLTEAEFILSAGAGVSDWRDFHALARALGAAEGGSRVVCDSGDLPRERQIGASGTLVAPRCYLALGISGAPQHLQGIARAEQVIAVNADPHAEIMKRADLAVVGDAKPIMDALLRLLRAMRDVA